MSTWDKWKPWYKPKEWTPTSKKVECKFCKLELVYKNDHMGTHLENKKNNGKMRGGGGFGHCVNAKGQLSKTLFSRWGIVWQ